MKKIILFTFTLLLGFNTYAQMMRNGRRNNMNTVPQTNREPSEADKEKMKREAEDRKQEFIANFITTLEADDFQKEIIKQTISSYFEKTLELIKIPFENSLARKDAFDKFKESHFKELKTLISENNMTKINSMLDGEFDEKEVKKKKKKKKKRKKNKDN